MPTRGDCSAASCVASFVNHEPSLAGNVTLLALFVVLIPIAFIFGLRYQTSVFSSIFILGTVFEVVGYVGRVLYATSPKADRINLVPALVGTMMGPTIVSVALYRLLPPIVAVYGDAFQAWRPHWHNVVFHAFSAVAVVLQVVGCALVFANESSMVDIGLNLLVAGLAVHVATLLLFALLGVRFAIAVNQRRDRLEDGLVVYNTSRFKVFICTLSLSLLLLLVRALYRIVPIAQGASSSSADNEVLFLVLDGILVFLALLSILAGFPGRLLGTSLPPTTTSSIHNRRMSQKPERAYRPPPVQLRPTTQTPKHSPAYYNNNRMSVKTAASHSPRNQGQAQKNMVDHEALW